LRIFFYFFFLFFFSVFFAHSLTNAIFSAKSRRTPPASMHTTFLPPPLCVQPFIPSKDAIVHTLQGRVVVLSLHNIPAAGEITLTIRNIGGALNAEDVTDNFVTVRTVRNDVAGAGSMVQWKMRSEYATSKLPCVRKRINQMDNQTVHAIEFTFSAPRQRDVRLASKKFLVVIGRGGGEREIAKAIDLDWQELEGMGLSSLAGAPMSCQAKNRREQDAMEDIERNVTEETASIPMGKRKRLAEQETTDSTAQRRKKTSTAPTPTGENGGVSIDSDSESDKGEIGDNAKEVKEGGLTDIRRVMGQALVSADGPSTLMRQPVSSPPIITTTTTTTTSTTTIVGTDIDKETRGGAEPFETFTLQPQRSTHPRPLPAVAAVVSPTQPSKSADPIHASGGTLTPTGVAIDGPESMNLSIRLIEMMGKTALAWGSLVAHNTELAIAIHNPSDEHVRIVCHVHDKKEKRLPMDGKLVMDLVPRQSSVMCKFRALHHDGPIQLHFLAAVLPLMPGRPLFHTRLFVNVQREDPSTY
jgi:hypothetical protein